MSREKLQNGRASTARFNDKAGEFERLYSESYRFVYNYVRYRMSDSDAAEDVVSEAFFAAARAFSRFDPNRSKFTTWVISIAINCMNSYYRKERPTVALDAVPESSFADESVQEEVENRALVEQLLRTLDDDERLLVVMKYREGKRNVDIARELNMNASTVSTVLARAIEKMRGAMRSCP
ncbi:MAG: sigma-70 family RNA polymerase sigma factor [Eggerthellaceae bacterium]|nr:sigma-70 family RNA polymerase sigma factor [Eggerthellaceae bacterium]